MQVDSVGQYRITGLIGQGGMGAVYAAEHALIGRLAAVKLLLPEYSKNQEIVQRFFNEARAATAIRHPGIVEIYDFGWHQDGSAYIVMELLSGEALSSRIARTRLSYPAMLALCRQIAGALAAAHAKGIVHRDLKPDNVFLVPDPEVPGGERIKLLDFGIAKLATDQTGGMNKTRTGAVMGTPTYMAPEQCRGVTVDHRADLYALGCIMFELCTGRPPFSGEGSGDVLAAHIYVPAPTLASIVPGVPRELESLVQRLLAKSPNDRYQHATEVIQAIDAMNNGAFRTSPEQTGPAHVRAASAAPTTLSGAAGDRPKPMAGKSRSTLIVAAVAVLAIAGGVFAIVSQQSNDKPATAAAAPETPTPTEPAPAKPEPAAPTPAPAPAPAPPAPAPTPAQPEPPKQIDVSIDSKPAGAEVIVDGKSIGKTPYKGQLPAADKDLQIVLKLSGHKEKKLTVRADAAITESVKLEAKSRTRPQNRDQSVNPF